MKKILSLLLFLSLEAKAQRDISKIKFEEPPDSTAIGTPDGTPAQKEIGPAGGRISSDDGRVELIFPAGALTTNTNISIQPTPRQTEWVKHTSLNHRAPNLKNR